MLCLQEAPCEQLQPIKKNQVIRLNHVETTKWLHSHNHASPLSQNGEVSAYGGPSKSDSGDAWVILWDGAEKTWKRNTKVRVEATLSPHQDFCGASRRF